MSGVVNRSSSFFWLAAQVLGIEYRVPSIVERFRWDFTFTITFIFSRDQVAIPRMMGQTTPLTSDHDEPNTCSHG